MYKKIILILLIMVFSTMSFIIFAEDEIWLTDENTEAIFTDVNVGEWYYEAVMKMNRYGIISGYGDNTFRPLEAVSREEFAAMMVRALKLEFNDTTSSFIDVEDGYWASPSIEAAKNYITGYKLNNEYSFKPLEDAVREDMAVALVRALDKSTKGEELLSSLDDFIDKDQVSPNLYEYVASAIYNNLMIGYLEEDIKSFKPMNTLTRAEAAALLLSVVKEEKIVFEEEKIVFEEETIISDDEFLLEVEIIEGGINLSWNSFSDENVLGYKIVASKYNLTPAYPLDGYAKYIQGNSTIIYNGDLNTSGDFISFEPGEEYYFSITAIIGEVKYLSNTLKVKMPEAVTTEGKILEVKLSQMENGILVEWDEIIKEGLQGYKVVASKYDESPVYPENGYAKWITNLDDLNYFIEPYSNYNGGDLGGKFKPGETYNISVTAVYDSIKIPGNTVTYIMPGELEEQLNIKQRIPQVNVTVVEDHLVVEWGDILLEGLEGYKIVASISNPNPIYSEDGYAYWITDLSSRMQEIYPNADYNGGDLGGKFISGENYYISVTAIYLDDEISGNSMLIEMP